MLGRRVRFTHLFILAAALALIAAACSGDGGEEERASEEQQAPEEQPPAEEETGEDAEGLSGLAQQWAETPASITYRLTGEGVPPGEMILHWKPPGSWRTDFSTEQGESIFISAGDTSYLCGSGMGTEEASCFESPGGAAQNPIPFAGLFTGPEALVEQIDAAPGGADIERGSETIAGEKASCFNVSGGSGGAQGEIAWCFASDGVLLLSSTTTAGVEGGEPGEFVMEATSVQRKVADDAFEPPFPVMEIPQGPGA